ncbi:hypothetical protein [Pseudotabrizicola sp. L79]|uniref:hypothetical protein n=1 Tax=Pseudotabrizicola sp. L79 TaxID=3118402 RepID=UPI002F91F805
MELLRLSGPGQPESRPCFSALLATRDGPLGQTARRLVHQGADLDVIDELYACLTMIGDDPRACDLVVVDCDGFDGLAAVRRAFGRLGPDERRAPVILLSMHCAEQVFPQQRMDPVLLRAPLSRVALRLALEIRLPALFSAKGW